MHFICYLGAEISSVLPRLVRKMLNLILAGRLSYKLSVQIQSDCLLSAVCLSLARCRIYFPQIGRWQPSPLRLWCKPLSEVLSPVVTLHSPVIVNRSHKNSFIILIFILAFCFVLLQVFKVVSYHYAFHVSHASLIPDTSCSKQRLTKTLSAPAHPG